jgi:hypothetical protein
MMNDQLSSPPQSRTDELKALQVFARVLDLLSDSAATAARVKELTDAAAQHSTLLESIKTESAELDRRRQAHLDAMVDEREAHESKLRQDRMAFAAECDRRQTALREAEAKAAAAQAAADSAKQHAVTVSNDLEARLSMIHGAASAPLPARH